ncbi:MAG TPA: anti-sigma factor, partial [Sphingorhabdus sp.]|nr:anti-sigma factor [Sphingorhabdus sp.]
RIEKAMAEDAGLAEAVERERALRAKLSAHFDPVLDEDVPDRLSALLTGNVDTSFTARREAKEVRRGWSLSVQRTSIAASLAVGLMIGGYAFNSGGGDVRSAGGQLIASGALDTALDTQLASAQGANPAVRIGTSFANANGEYCRTFESASLDGIACNAGGDWQLRRTLSGGGASDYRQASAGELAEAAAAMMADDPLDATAEKAAMAQGWR